MITDKKYTTGTNKCLRKSEDGNSFIVALYRDREKLNAGVQKSVNISSSFSPMHMIQCAFESPSLGGSNALSTRFIRNFLMNLHIHN